MSRLLRIVAVVVGVLIVLILVLPFLIPVNRFRPTIEEKLSAAMGRRVQVGNLSLSLWSGSLGAEDLSIADDPKFSSSAFLTAKSLKVGVEVFPLIFSRSLHITGILIDSPQVALLRDAAGRWNFSSLGGPATTPANPAPASSMPSDLEIQEFSLKDGKITVGKAGASRQSVYDHVNVSASNVSVKNAFPVKATANLPNGGSFAFDGRIGPIDPADAALSPLDAKLNVKGFDLASSGALDSSLGLGGLMDLDAGVTSKNGIAETKGSLTLTKLQLVAGGSPSKVPAVVAISTKSDLRKDTGILQPSTVTIGKAVAHISGTYDSHGEYTTVNAKFTAQDMPATDLEAFLPAIGVNMPEGAKLSSGALNADLTIQGPTNRLITTGSVGLANGRLSGFDLGAKLSAIAALAGVKTGSNLEISKVSSNVHLAPDGLRSESFLADLPAIGTLTGAGTIDAKNNLNFKMLANLKSGVGGAVSKLGGVLGGGGGKGGIPFLIQGTTANPRFLPDVGGLAKGIVKDNKATTTLGGLFKKKPSQ
ncbi:MAG TPA: AsmA family protein [Methylomirabilota bacterium]|nr:AsmA family protein [Methylomirabilota bacterium]